MTAGDVELPQGGVEELGRRECIEQANKNSDECMAPLAWRVRLPAREAGQQIRDQQVRAVGAQYKRGEKRQVDGLNGTIDVGTVAGNVRVTSIRLLEGDVCSVSGNVRVKGPLAGSGRLDVEAVSGNVEVAVPADTSADFYLSSFSGSIGTDFGAQGEKEDRYSPAKSARFTLGGGGFQVNVETFSGKCEVRRMER